MSNKPKSKHPEDTNKNYNSQNTENYLFQNKKGSDLSNVERPAQGTTHTSSRAEQASTNQGSKSLDKNDAKYQGYDNEAPNVS